jgi:N-dimethylarginine dimethylaminohydrolase
MNYTSHSETGRIKLLFVKNARQAFKNEEHVEKFWKELNFSAKPDFENSLDDYESFESILKSRDMELHYFPEDPSVNMDSVYCRDASIATNHGMIICNMGKAGRMNEPSAEKKEFEASGIPVLGTITAPGTLEGGDVAWLDEHTLAVGHTYRTNEEGIRQLTALIQPLGVEVITVQLPHYKGPTDVFHLMSVLSPIDTNLAVVYSPLIPIVFRNCLIHRGFQLIEVPDEEFESMGCNVLALAPGYSI